jgi:hypothetical protein
MFGFVGTGVLGFGFGACWRAKAAGTTAMLKTSINAVMDNRRMSSFPLPIAVRRDETDVALDKASPPQPVAHN